MKNRKNLAPQKKVRCKHKKQKKLPNWRKGYKKCVAFTIWCVCFVLCIVDRIIRPHDKTNSSPINNNKKKNKSDTKKKKNQNKMTMGVCFCWCCI